MCTGTISVSIKVCETQSSNRWLFKLRVALSCIVCNGWTFSHLNTNKWNEKRVWFYAFCWMESYWKVKLVYHNLLFALFRCDFFKIPIWIGCISATHVSLHTNFFSLPKTNEKEIFGDMSCKFEILKNPVPCIQLNK